ncbi:hypothetical protein [Bacillus sp. BML-BC021]|nr:hypothetical protein [Bacillus sp. BML-BC021]
MQTLICPACGCSLVRLGIEKERAAVYKYKFTRRPAKTYFSIGMGTY